MGGDHKLRTLDRKIGEDVVSSSDESDGIHKFAQHTIKPTPIKISHHTRFVWRYIELQMESMGTELEDKITMGTNEKIVMSSVTRYRGGAGTDDEMDAGDDATVESEGEPDESTVQDNTRTSLREAEFEPVGGRGAAADVEEEAEGAEAVRVVPNIVDEDSPLLTNKDITTAVYDRGSALLAELADEFADSFVGDGSTTFLNITELRKCREAMWQFLEGPEGWVARFLKLNDILLIKHSSQNGNETQRKKKKKGVEEIEADRIRRIVALARDGHVGKANQRLQQIGGLIVPPSVEWCLAKFPQQTAATIAPVVEEAPLRMATRSQQPPRPAVVGVHVEKYDEGRDLVIRGFTTKEITAKIKAKRTGTAAGPSGITHDWLKLLAKGKKGDKNMEGMTALVTVIVRGWLPPWAREMLHALKGFALPKKGPPGSWRPIGVSEPVLDLVDGLIGDVIGPKCKRLSGSFQRGLSRNGIEQLAIQTQIIFDAGEARGGDVKGLDNHIDFANAFNELYRPPVIDLAVTEFSPFANFFIQAYGTPIDVQFTEDISVKSCNGVVQGRATSAMIFDALLGKTLKKLGIKQNLLRLIHDDLFLKSDTGTLRDLKDQMRIVREAGVLLGLTIQPTKTECLHTGTLSEIEKANIREALGLEQVAFSKGLVIGGIPVGTNDFISGYMVEKMEEIKGQMDVVSTKLLEEPGVAIAIMRKCVCPKTIHLSRVIPQELWHELALQHSKSIRETFEKILRTDTLDRDRHAGDDEKLEHRLFTKVANGGLGLWTPERYGDAACVAAWTDNKESFSQLGTELGEGGDGGRKWMILRAAENLRKLLLVDAEGGNRVVWGKGQCKVGTTAQKLIGELADGDFLGSAKGSGKTQNLLSGLVDSMQCQIYTDTQFGWARTKCNREHTTVVGGTSVDRAALKQWIGSQHPLAGMFVDILHLKGCRMSSKQIRAAVLARIGVTSGRDHGICPTCRQKGKRNNGQYESFEEHAELCTTHAGGCNFSAECHSDILFELAGFHGAVFTWLPTTKVITGRIPISKYFDVRDQQGLSAVELAKTLGLESDLLITPRGDEELMIDICVTSVQTKDNAKASGTTGACAAYYEKKNKDKKHAKFMDEGKHLTSMGFDSRGGFSPKAMQVLRSLFAPNPRVVWKDDMDRLWLQKRTIAVISAIIHKWAGIRRDRLLDSQIRDRAVLL